MGEPGEAGEEDAPPGLRPGQGTAIVTGVISIAIGVAYLALVSVFYQRGAVSNLRRRRPFCSCAPAVRTGAVRVAFSPLAFSDVKFSPFSLRAEVSPAGEPLLSRCCVTHPLLSRINFLQVSCSFKKPPRG